MTLSEDLKVSVPSISSKRVGFVNADNWVNYTTIKLKVILIK